MLRVNHGMIPKWIKRKEIGFKWLKSFQAGEELNELLKDGSSRWKQANECKFKILRIKGTIGEKWMMEKESFKK